MTQRKRKAVGRPDDPGLSGAAVGLCGPDRGRLSGPPGMEKQVVVAESKNTVLIHPVYREMRTALNQMETGTPEIRAYGEFGRRIGLGCYIKFAIPARKQCEYGRKDLRRLLEEEMETASFREKNLRSEKARRRPQSF